MHHDPERPRQLVGVQRPHQSLGQRRRDRGRQPVIPGRRDQLGAQPVVLLGRPTAAILSTDRRSTRVDRASANRIDSRTLEVTAVIAGDRATSPSRRGLLLRLAPVLLLATVLACAAPAPTPTPTPTATLMPTHTTGIPPNDWRGPSVRTASGSGVQVITLGSLTTGSDFVVGILAFVGSDASSQLEPSAAGATGRDSRGTRYAVTHTVLAQRNGVTVGSVTVRGVPQAGRKVIGLDITSLQATRGQGVPTSITGSWSVDLIEQLSDAPQSCWCSVGGQNPVTANGSTVRFTRGGNVLTLVFEPAGGGQQEAVFALVDDKTGIPRVITCQEKEAHDREVTGGRPQPTVPPHTPDPRDPVPIGTPIRIPLGCP